MRKAQACGGLVCFLLLLAGCSSEGPGSLELPGGPGAPAAQNGAPGSTPGASQDQKPPSTPGPSAGVSCPSTNPVVEISVDQDARDLSLVADAVYFRSDAQVMRVGKDGSGRAPLYASTYLLRSFVDADAALVVERAQDPGTETPTLRRVNLDQSKGFTTTPSNWVAVNTYGFGSDKDYYYVQTEVSGAGDTLYAVSKTTGAQTKIVNFGNGPENFLSSPIVQGSDVWVVRGGQRVYKIADVANQGGPFTTTPDPREMFATGYHKCALAVGASDALCGDQTSIEGRDLNGANPRSVFDAQKSAFLGSLGAPRYMGQTLYVPPGDAHAAGSVGNVIRALSSAGGTIKETVVACGRGLVKELAVDQTALVWSERADGATGKTGVFLTKR